MFPKSDIDIMFNDFGVLASFNGASTLGILDKTTEEGYNSQSGEPVWITRIIFTYQSSNLPGLKAGSEIKVEGKTYFVRELRFTNQYITKAYLGEDGLWQ